MSDRLVAALYSFFGLLFFAFFLALLGAGFACSDRARECRKAVYEKCAATTPTRDCDLVANTTCDQAYAGLRR